MKTILLIISLLILTNSSSAQKKYIFKDVNFDSATQLIALSSAFSNIGTDSKAYCFLVDKLDVLNRIKSEWVATDQRPRLSIEEYSINLLVVKNKQLIDSRLLIYPDQGIIHMGNDWFNFDMKSFTSIQAAYPLNYHSQKFSFTTYLDYSFFSDSIQATPSFLFLYEPTAQFEGHFNIIAQRSQDPDSPILVLRDINKELEALSPKNKFNVQNAINDPFNLNNTQQMKIKVFCSKALYDSYKGKFMRKEAWVPSTVDTKVIFKD